MALRVYAEDFGLLRGREPTLPSLLSAVVPTVLCGLYVAAGTGAPSLLARVTGDPYLFLFADVWIVASAVSLTSGTAARHPILRGAGLLVSLALGVSGLVFLARSTGEWGVLGAGALVYASRLNHLRAEVPLEQHRLWRVEAFLAIVVSVGAFWLLERVGWAGGGLYFGLVAFASLFRLFEWSPRKVPGDDS